MRKNKIVILGMGNPLFRDEGLGIHLIKRLMQELITDGVELVDGGTDGLALLNVVEATDYLLVVDAVMGDNAPGTVCKLAVQDMPMQVSGHLSTHQTGFQEILALAALRGRLPQHLVLLGIQPQCLDWGTQLSPPVARALPELTGLISEQLKEWLDC
ncbi:MAG TPA: HyaD/HybD family hydrogenase maturation endopeptidase [Syntrophomonas sp.]|mgnify:CR=1 FL=1|nr:HyaD/HybD family hydrogenase maturation endopeptidase [Syntrophomonas sp.]HRW12044.1 HyaD/HybD family hydrogenase maturation endopeptidase [Syntrophomonas sp.]